MGLCGWKARLYNGSDFMLNSHGMDNLTGRVHPDLCRRFLLPALICQYNILLIFTSTFKLDTMFLAVKKEDAMEVGGKDG